MKTLCIETSSKICSVALLENTNLIDKIEKNEGLTHSEILMPTIQEILTKNNISIKNINLIVCDIGPGSFTGIRIGVATAKAFSDSLNIKTIGISSLECYARKITSNGIICSLIDCKNNNCYYALYKKDNNSFTVISDSKADSIENCLELLKYKYSDSNITFIGENINIFSESIKNTIKNYSLIPDNPSNLDTYTLGLAGIEKYQNNSDEELLPLYLKKPQAQRQLENKTLSFDKMDISDLKDLDISLFDEFWNLNQLSDELNSTNSTFFVAKIDKEIVGFGGIKTILDESEIMNIAIKNNFRRQGIGKLLLEKLINYAQSLNIEKIHLEVNENNFPAISLYKKFNFIEDGRRKNYYNNSEDAILMTLNI